MLILISVATVSGISAGLALILILAEAVFANYGDCKITINDEKELTVKGGASLLSSLAENKVFIPSACGGRGSCGFCKVKVISGGGPLLPTEKPFLNAKEMAENIRLSCQIKVKENIKIEIPDELFNIQRFTASVIKIVDQTYDIKEITFKLTEPQKIKFKAGQYVQLETPKYKGNNQRVSRAYSISSLPEEDDIIQLIIRKVPDGICTTYVHEYLKEGDTVNFVGPFGDFYIRNTDAEMIFIAGGSGKAPIKSMVGHLKNLNSTRRMVYFFGARTMKDLYLTELFEQTEKEMDNFVYVPVLSNPDENDKWTGRTGYIPAYFDEFITNPQNTEAYLCGSPAMINAVQKGLIEKSVPREKIYYDSFS
ncbi:MAG: FAD-binding oxidoreductase [Candidatus Cloacimonetes bacterium]|nr:FAD-binding oxidoreductase [Candidatus Cloacimonadota bacterium]